MSTINKVMKFLRDIYHTIRLEIRRAVWILRDRPMVHYDGYHCGCCGKWVDESFSIPKYQSCGWWWDTWGVCDDHLSKEEVEE